MKTKIGLLLLASLLIGGSAFAKTIREYFDSIQGQLDSLNDEEANLATDSKRNMNISVKEFVAYKANLEFLYGINQVRDIPDNDQILNNVIKQELFIQHAIELGIRISEDEVNDYIHQLRKGLEDDHGAINEIVNNQIRISGYSEEEYWDADATRKTYEKYLLSAKLISHLELMNHEDLEIFKNQLFDNSEVSIDKKILMEL